MKRVSIFLITVALIAGMAGCGPLPSEIHDWYDLDAIRNNLGGSYLLMNDLNPTTPGYDELASPTANEGKGWQPIGNLVDRFTGTLDGQGYEISDLFINRPDESFVGPFGFVGEEGVIKDIGMMNFTVTGGMAVGGLAGHNGGTVSNSYSTGNVTGGDIVGCLLGGNGGTVSNSYSTGSVTGNAYVGGLAGGNNEGTVSNSYSTGNVTGYSDVGGLVGNKYGSFVSNSFWDIETSGQSTSAGGIGKNTTEMQDIDTFSGVAWDIVAVAHEETNPSYIWNIVDDETYPFLSWQPVS